MTLYVDIIFLENILMNSIILLATGVILKSSIKIINNLIGSTIGAIYAVIIYTTHIAVYSNLILKIILSIAMVYITFKPPNIKSFLKHIIIFYLTSFTFGGVAFALIYFVQPRNILIKDGVLVGTYPIKIILIGGILGFIIITISFKNIKGKFTKKDMQCNIIINKNDREANIPAIVDTGNVLKDSITKMPVIVIEKKKLEGIFPNQILENIGDIISGKEVDLGEYASKIRVIPFKSLGKENGILLGIKTEAINIIYQDSLHYVKNIIIGIYNGNLSRSGRYYGLVGLDVLNEQ